MSSFTLSNLCCRLSKELPVSPVVAEDGCLYECYEITKYLKTNTISPVTGNVIGKRLVRVPFVTITIRTLIDHEVSCSDVNTTTAQDVTKKLNDSDLSYMKEALLTHVRGCQNRKCLTCNKIRHSFIQSKIRRYSRSKSHPQEVKQEVKQE